MKPFIPILAGLMLLSLAVAPALAQRGPMRGGRGPGPQVDQQQDAPDRPFQRMHQKRDGSGPHALPGGQRRMRNQEGNCPRIGPVDPQDVPRQPRLQQWRDGSGPNGPANGARRQRVRDGSCQEQASAAADVELMLASGNQTRQNKGAGGGDRRRDGSCLS
jgi:hypothetical protein